MNAINVLNSNLDLQELISNSSILSEGGITKVKVARCALYTIGTLSALSTIPLIFTVPPVAIASGGLAYFCFHKAFHIYDYQNPRELNQIRIDAFHLGYQELISSHGIQNIIAYKIASRDLVSQKFLEFCSANSLSKILSFNFKESLQKGLISFDLARQGFFNNLISRGLSDVNFQNVKQFFDMSIISVDDYSFLTYLDDQSKQYHKEFNDALMQLDFAFSGRTSRLLQDLDEKIVQAKRDARKLKEEIMSKGYNTCASRADQISCFDLIFNRNSIGDVVLNNLDYKNEAYLNIDEVANKVSQDFLKSKLDEFEAQKKYIQQNNIGADAQVAYDLQLSSVRQYLDTRLNNLYYQVCNYCQCV